MLSPERNSDATPVSVAILRTLLASALATKRAPSEPKERPRGMLRGMPERAMLVVVCGRLTGVEELAIR
ncbi:hypothetical protein D3C78_1511260 [compost metagenome]